MHGPFNASRSRRKPSINITSLIDVMFLLLIFFMVSSTFREYYGVDVSLPGAETAVARETESREIVIDRDGTIFFGQQRVDAAGLRQSLLNVLREEPDARIVLRADRSTGFEHVLRVMDTAQAVGGRQLIVLARPEGGEAG
jgi:biopolymer transport protein ExbD